MTAISGLLIQLATQFATVIVAIVAAVWAVRKDAEARITEGYHQYVDERRSEYSDFLRQMNNAVGAFWGSIAPADGPALENAVLRLDVECLELDIRTYLLMLTAPYEVSSWARQINGAVQKAGIDRFDVSGYEEALQVFEKAKPSLLLAMQNDIRMIETAGSRKKSEKMSLKAPLK